MPRHGRLSDPPYSAFATDIRDAGPSEGAYQQGMKAMLLRLWRCPPPQACPAPADLELPLLPSPRLRIAIRMMLLMSLLYALELWLSGHRLAAPAMLLLAASCARRRRPTSDGPRTLVLATDGRLFLRHGQAMEQVQLAPASLRLGSHLLLVLRAGRRTVRGLLGPDNLPPELLAACQRRLPRSASTGTALH